ncbi:DNA-directed RNA polymerase subunit delta [Gracilibacillus thailandensis]|uniref:Probable DNA-directed RNA polymerase subunit delta n=1 Tax=Gracilibacillus thailandensis TaxID=563735 RepID=A0A6N7QVF9_9BACI|nr:DNA-directed RNA polymerase subunit delta [Gracilibacillus thailandensis]MRI66083.1 DNA-directed RNA polymerase subunit delta [Gracilibacillus thailandensis]
MSLKDLTKERIDELAMIDIATLILEEENKAMDFREIFERVAKLKELSETEKDAWISQFYTDLNIDGRFMTKGSNLWGLKRWYPVEEIDEDITPVPKKKKKKKAKKKKAPVEPLEETEDLDETVIGDEDLTGFDEDLDTDDIVDDDFDFDDDDIEDEVDDDFDTDDELEK